MNSLKLPPKLQSHITKLQIRPFNSHSWMQLIEYAQTLSSQESQIIFDEFFKIFPTHARSWRIRIEQFLREKKYEETQNAFTVCLPICIDVDLYLSYITFVKTVHSLDPSPENDLNSEKAILQAYDYALNQTFVHPHVDKIHKSYFEYIKTLLQKHKSNTYRLSEIQMTLRKAYQSALKSILHQQSDDIWREYDAFEHNLNKTLAKNILSELQPEFATMKNLSRHRKKKFEFVSLRSPARIPELDYESDLRVRDAQQAVLWKRVLRWELANPLKLSVVEHRKRVLAVFRMALQYQRHNPEIWLMLINYTHESFSATVQANSILQEVENVFKQAEEAMPYSLLLKFLRAEYYERQKLGEAAKDMYETLMDEASRVDKDNIDGIIGSEGANGVRYFPCTNGKNESSTFSFDSDSSLVDEISMLCTLIVIQYMRFARRMFGPDYARKVFVRGKRLPFTSYHLYSFAAQLEYRMNNQIQFARNIFTAGSKQYEKDYDFNRQYSKFLFNINDFTNQRVLIEKLFTDFDITHTELQLKNFQDQSKKKRRHDRIVEDDSIHSIDCKLWSFGAQKYKDESNVVPPPSIAQFNLNRPTLENSFAALWKSYVELERLTSSDLTSIERAENRREAALQLSSPKIAILIDRFRYLNLWPCSLIYCEILELSVQKTILENVPLDSDAVKTGINSNLINRKQYAIEQFHSMIRPDLNSLEIWIPKRPPIDRLKMRYGITSPLPSILCDLLDILPTFEQYIQNQMPLIPIEWFLNQLRNFKFPQNENELPPILFDPDGKLQNDDRLNEPSVLNSNDQLDGNSLSQFDAQLALESQQCSIKTEQIVEFPHIDLYRARRAKQAKST